MGSLQYVLQTGLVGIFIKGPDQTAQAQSGLDLY